MSESLSQDLPEPAPSESPVAAVRAAPEGEVAPVIPWQRRRQTGRVWAYWKTVFLVLRRNGRLGAYLSGPVDYRDARKFRWMTIAHALAVPVLAAVLIVLIAAAWSDVGSAPGALDTVFAGASAGRAVVPDVLSAAALTGLAVVLGAAGLAGMTGAVSWFFCPKRFDAERQNRAIALSYYTSAPMALLVFSLVPMLAAAPFLQRWQSLLQIFSLIQCLLVLYWLQLALFAVRSVARRGVLGVVATGLLLPALWQVIAFVAALVPAGILMLALMVASLD